MEKINSIVERGNVLIVEDSPDARLLIKGILRQAGYRVLEADTGEKAIAIIEEAPSLILVLLDMNLSDSGLNGLEVFECIKPLKEEKNFKVIFVSGTKDKEVIATAIKNGADGFVIKPIRPSYLLQKITSVIGSTKHSEEIESKYKVKLSFQASLTESNVLPEIEVVEITYSTIVLKSSSDFIVGSLIMLKCQKLENELDYPNPFNLKVLRTIKKDFGLYYARCEMLALPANHEEKMKHLKEKSVVKIKKKLKS